MSRESLCQLGVSFLQNASTQSLPFSEQIQFLEGKGLSSEEIKQAMQSVSTPVKKDGWLWNVMFPVLIVGAGCTAYVLSKAMEEDHYEDRLDFRSEEGDDDDRDEIEMEGDSVEDSQLFHLNNNNNNNNLTLLNNDDNDNDVDRDLTDGSLNSESVNRHDDDSNMGRLVTVLEHQTTAIQQAIELFTVNVSSLVALAASREDNSSSVRSVPSTSTPGDFTPPRKEDDEKAGGDSNNNNSSNSDEDETTNTAIRSPESILGDIQQIILEVTRQNGDKEKEEGEGEQETRCSRIVEDEDSDEKMRDNLPLSAAVHRGFSSIIMYIQKIIDNPKISRYHRLSTANSTFKSSVASLLDHEKLLEALGFQKRGTFWEWQTAPPNSSSSGSNSSTKNSQMSQKEAKGNTEESLRLASRDVYFIVLQESILLLEARLNAGVTAVPPSDETPPSATPSAYECTKQQESQQQSQPQPNTDVTGDIDTSCNKDSIPIENEVFSKTAASENTHMKFEEIFQATNDNAHK